MKNLELRSVLNNTGRLLPLLALVMALTRPLGASPRVFPTGTTLYDPGKAYQSFVIFGSPDGKTHLIDLDGNEVRQWSYLGFPSELIDPRNAGGQKGHVLVQLENGEGIWSGIFNNKTVGELDWDGKVIWQWGGDKTPEGPARQNHDWHRLPNGNTFLLVSVKSEIFGKKDSPDQEVVEVAPDGKTDWEWKASEHIDEFGFSPEGLAYLKRNIGQGLGAADGFLTINDLKVVGPNHWFDEGDKRFNPDNLIFDSREANFIAIIDKATGKIVWRLGPVYPNPLEASGPHSLDRDPVHSRILQNKVPRPVDQLSGQHDAQIIQEGLPGAGNILVFDNQGGAGFPPVGLGIFAGSRVLEIDPIKKEIVWQYTGADSDRPVWSFFSSFISSARRLPNGNTLIDEGFNGRLFQVTPQGEIVWEYVSPYFTHALLAGQKVYSNWVYRAQPVPFDWVPDGTPHADEPVTELDITTFRVPGAVK
jgi:hypothetical protein